MTELNGLVENDEPESPKRSRISQVKTVTLGTDFVGTSFLSNAQNLYRFCHAAAHHATRRARPYKLSRTEASTGV